MIRFLRLIVGLAGSVVIVAFVLARGAADNAAAGRRPLPAPSAADRSAVAAPPPTVGDRVRRPLAGIKASDPLFSVDVADIPAGMSATGTSFPVADGVWLTARHVANSACRHLYVSLADGRTFPATIRYLDADADLAVIEAPGSGPALPISQAAPREEETGYSFGYPTGVLGATADQLMGRARMKFGGRLSGVASVLAWAETARFPDDLETVKGMSGGPMLDAGGAVIGIFVATSVRRGRNYTVAPEIIRATQNEVFGEARTSAPAFEGNPPVALANAAGSLAGKARIARVFCDPQ